MKNRQPYSRTIRAAQMKPAYFRDGKYLVVAVEDPKELHLECDPKLWAIVEDPKTGYDQKSKTRFLLRLNDDGVVVHIDMYPDNAVMHQFSRSDLEGRTTAEMLITERGDIEVRGTPNNMRRSEVLELFIDALAEAKKWPVKTGEILKKSDVAFRVKRADGDIVELEPLSLDIYKSRPFVMGA